MYIKTPQLLLFNGDHKKEKKKSPFIFSIYFSVNRPVDFHVWETSVRPYVATPFQMDQNISKKESS